jgi:WD40 repeat protein
VQRSRARQRREVRRWRVVTAVLVVLVLAAALSAAALSVVAVSRGNALSEQLDVANAEVLAQAALARAANDPVTSTQLALAAWRLDPNNPSARGALLRQYVAMRSVESVVAGVAKEQIIAFIVSQDGRTIAQADSNGIVVTGLTDGPPRSRVLPGSPPLNAYRVATATDRFVAVIDRTGAVLLWDLTTDEGPQIISGPRPAISDDSPLGFSDDEHLVWLEPRPAGAELRIWNVVTNSPVPHGLGPIQEPDVVRVALTADRTRVMIQSGNALTRRVEGPTFVRSLADGALVSTLPEHTVLINRGAATCVPAGPDATGPAVAVITGPDLVTPLRRLPLEEYSCDDFDRMFTRDRQHLADRIGDPSDVDLVRIRDVTDGSAYEVSLPQDWNSARDEPRLTLAEKMTVLPGPHGTRTVLVPHDRSLLRLIAEPNPHIAEKLDPLWVGLSDDRRTLVANTEGGYATFDPVSSRPLAQLGEELRNTWSVFPTNLDERLTLRWIPTQDGGVWIAEYSLPTLEPVLRVQVPARAGEALSAVDTDAVADRIYALGNGLLTGWDRTTGAPLGPPVDLATTQERRTSFSHLAEIEGRPGHPGEVAVIGAQNAIEIWNVERGAHITTITQPNGSWSHGFAFDSRGSRLVNVTNAGALEVWDIDRGELIAAPIPIERVEQPVGIAADGTVLTVGEGANGEDLLTLWDTAAGRAVGSFRVSLEPNPEIVDGIHVNVQSSNGYLAAAHWMALTPQQWVDALCRRFARRPFTDTELAALPKGSAIPHPAEGRGARGGARIGACRGSPTCPDPQSSRVTAASERNRIVLPPRHPSSTFVIF